MNQMDRCSAETVLTQLADVFKRTPNACACTTVSQLSYTNACCSDASPAARRTSQRRLSWTWQGAKRRTEAPRRNDRLGGRQLHPAKVQEGENHLVGHQ